MAANFLKLRGVNSGQLVLCPAWSILEVDADKVDAATPEDAPPG